MKKALAFFGALAFVLVLLIKPFDFMETYSVHVGHAVHNAKANTDDGHVSHLADSKSASDHNVLTELTKAGTDSSDFRNSLWLTGLLVIGLASLALVVWRGRNDQD